MAKKVLGLDLGVGSIGWAVIEEDQKNNKISGLGSRIIPLSTDDSNEFSQGKTISKNASRTLKRTQRKGYDRYQQRRENLTTVLRKYDMLPDETLIKLPQKHLWGLRARATEEKITLPELGRVLYHLNQKRGYKSSRQEDGSDDKKQREYVENINKRYSVLRNTNKTIGQYFYENLSADPYYRVKDQIFPRVAYVEEFDRIMANQQKHHHSTLTDTLIKSIRNEIIYYQRSLKSCKHLVSVCEFSKRTYVGKDGQTVLSGPKVSPRSSPLFQVCKIWESINNLVLTNKYGEQFHITDEHKQAMFLHLDNNDKLTLSDLYKILGIKKSDGWWGGKAIGKGIQGNTTKMQIRRALQDFPSDDLLRFNLVITDGKTDTETGEILPVIDTAYEQESLYRLWHGLYSMKDKSELEKYLESRFGISDKEVINRLYALDFVKQGYGNKSAKAIRRILPFLMQGYGYADSCARAGFRHSESLTSDENASRMLQDKLELIQKNELRQPVVEKILNQMINLVNALMERFGRFDEIRVELARELKQSRDERNETFKRINENERQNTRMADLIRQTFHLYPTRSRIQKYRMWEEAGHQCFYCGQPVNCGEFLKGFEVEVEHIVPRSLLFDDSFSNKVCSCRTCNQEKGNRTAYDFMRSQPGSAFEEYLERVAEYYKTHKIGKTKYQRLLTPAESIPADFIERQLRESQYIARKAKDLLSEICYNVYSTTGGVTDFLRHLWGWDTVLHDLNLEKYKLADLTEIREINHRSHTYKEERIINWNKRMDQRHHAIDALVVACTKQVFIQYINNLQSLRDVNFKPSDDQGQSYKNRLGAIERYILSHPHFTTEEVKRAVRSILISYKPGKKVAVWGHRSVYRNGKRVIKQERILVPRGPLSEESIYGQIMRYEKNKKGKTSLKSQYVIKYPLTSLKAKDVDSIIDARIRDLVRNRLTEYNNKEIEAFREPLWLDEEKKIQVRSVRCFTGLSAVVPLSYDENGVPTGYVKPGNNHHIAIYMDETGKYQEHVVSFWHAVERKKYGLPVIITNPEAIWDTILSGNKNLPQDFLSNLPDAQWQFIQSMQQNEMFIMGINEDDYQEAIQAKDYITISKHLYRVQKLSKKEYVFRHHLETKVDDKYNGNKDQMKSKQMGKLIVIQSFDSWKNRNPHKVRITQLGKIISYD